MSELAVVTGASGLVGGNLAVLLVDAGVRVRATRRTSTKVGHLTDVPIEWVDADLADVDALARAFDGADVVFHCAAVPTQTRRKEGPHRAANVEGTRRVIEACKRARVGRLVHCSSVVTCAIARDGAPDVTEGDAWNFPDYGLDEVYAVTKRDAELAVIAACSAGDVDAVVVNPGTMFGPLDAKPSSGRLIQALDAGKIVASSSGVSSFVDVRDVCRGMIAAWKKGRRGERYILAGPNLHYAEIFAIIARELGKRPPRFTMPDALVKLAGATGDVVERITGREVDLNSGVAAYGVCRGYRFSSAKAERDLGYTTSSLEIAVRDAVRWLRAHDLLAPVR